MSGSDPLDDLRAAADHSRAAARQAVADLRRQRAATEKEHRADPSYGMAKRGRPPPRPP